MKNEELNDKKIRMIEDKIDLEKERLKKINSMYDDIESFDRDINKCIDLLAKSVKGSNVNNIFDDVNESSSIFYKSIVSSLDEELEASKKAISKLTEEKEAILKSKRGDEDANSNNKKE